jgi:surface antigen
MANYLTTTKLALSFCLMTAAVAGCTSTSNSTGPMANGTYLDQSETRQLTDVTQQAAEQTKPGERVNWEHKDTKSGLVTTVGWVELKSDSYVASGGEVCRDLEQVILKSGERHIESAKACRKTALANQPTNVAWVVRQS